MLKFKKILETLSEKDETTKPKKEIKYITYYTDDIPSFAKSSIEDKLDDLDSNFGFYSFEDVVIKDDALGKRYILYRNAITKFESKLDPIFGKYLKLTKKITKG